MKKRYILLGAFTLSVISSKAQKNNAPFKKEEVNKTDVSILYSQYLQNGNHSAVTGGTGTEKLRVYAPSAKIKRQWNDKNALNFQVGADVVSSASTDRIDYVVSSASRRDTRMYLNLGYTRRQPESGLEVSAGSGMSIESDYLSIPLQLGAAYTEKNRMRSYTFDAQLYFDDLRWGRFNPDFRRPVRLVYPSELRTREWFDNRYRRYSYNAKMGFTQVLSKRWILGVFPEIGYQTGVLATPFHRVYFNNDSLRVEKLPDQRLKTALALKINAFLGGRTILKNGIDLYRDDYGIAAFAFETETTLKFNRVLSLSPGFRWYTQKGSPYFAPYAQHAFSEKYYTSDYDLSDFQAWQGSLGFRYAPYRVFGKKEHDFEEIQLRYSFYYRSDGLKAHILSMAVMVQRGD